MYTDKCKDKKRKENDEHTRFRNRRCHGVMVSWCQHTSVNTLDLEIEGVINNDRINIGRVVKNRQNSNTKENVRHK
jgi:hypothetical protein